MVLHARGKAGRYVIDDDTMDAEERAALEAAIAAGIEDAERGNTIDAREFLEQLRARP
jgi:predicted transcriptional regulator